MNTNKRIAGAVVICGLVLLPVIGAHGEEASFPRHEAFSKKRAEWRKEKGQEIFAQLNLTEEQKQQLKKNRSNHREKMKASFEQMRSYKQALRQELMKAELDMGKINQIQSQTKALQGQMADERLESILEVRKVLTPEQFAQFSASLGKVRAERFSGKYEK